MIEYVKFWLAKEVLVPLIIFAGIVGIFGAVYGVAVLHDAFTEKRKSRKGGTPCLNQQK